MKSSLFNAIYALKDRHLNTELKQRIYDGFSWSLAGALVSRILALLTTIIVSKEIGRESFGELAILQSTIATLGEVAGMGVGLAATKYISEFKLNDPERASCITSLCVLISIIASISLGSLLHFYASETAAYLYNNPTLKGLISICAFTVTFASMNGVMTSVLRGLEKFKCIAKVNVISGFFSVAAQTVMVLNLGLKGVVYAILLTQILNFVLIAKELRSSMASENLTFTIRGLSVEIRPFFSFVIPAFLASSIVVPVTWFVNILLVNQRDGYSEMGVFNAANQWRMAILFVPLTIGNVVLPILSSLVKTGDDRQYLRVLYLNIATSASISTVLIVLVWAFAPYIMHSYGAAFEGESLVLRVLIIAAGLTAINNVIGQAIASLGRMWHGFGFNTLWAITLASAAYTLAPEYGALGIAVAYTLSYGLHTAIQFVYLYKNIGRLGGTK